IKTVNGAADFDTSNNSLITHPKIPASITIPYSFEARDSSTLWGLQNPDNEKTWQRIVRPIDGQQEEMIYLNGYNYETHGELDYWISPQINLSASPNAQLKFEMAFSPYTDEEYQESLLVAVSSDCGNTFELLQAPYNKKGASLKTQESSSDAFFPTTKSQFRTELVNLSGYAGEGDIRIAFVSINGY